MINDDLNFTLDSSNFPVSIEKFAAYLDGNLPDDEMQRVETVIENDEGMQGVMDGLEQADLTLAEYGQEYIQLPEEIAGSDFDIPNVIENFVGEGGCLELTDIAACASTPMIFDSFNEGFDSNEIDIAFDDDNGYNKVTDSTQIELINDINSQLLNNEEPFEDISSDDIFN